MRAQQFGWSSAVPFLWAHGAGQRDIAVAAGMLIMAAGQDGEPLDYKALERWTRWVMSGP